MFDGTTNDSPDRTGVPLIVRLKSSTDGGVSSPRPGAATLISVIVVGLNVLMILHVASSPGATVMFPLASQSVLRSNVWI